MVAVAPVAVVTTDGALSMTPFVAARSIVAPVTDAFPLVNAKTVNVKDEVPSAFKTLELELILIVATLAFAVVVDGVIAGALAAESGAPTVPGFPPPPPQAARAATSASPITYFNIFILTVL